MGTDAHSILILLGALIALGGLHFILDILKLRALQKMQRMFFAGPRSSTPVLQANWEIQKVVDGQWVSIGTRHEGHPDIHEAHNTPGLRVVKL